MTDEEEALRILILSTNVFFIIRQCSEQGVEKLESDIQV